MNFFKEFKSFALRGNVVDLAIGVVIGAAFGNLVNALVVDIFNPIIGILTSGVSFGDAKWIIREAVNSKGEISILYGSFIQTLVQFFIVAFAIFLVVKTMNKMKKQHDEKPQQPKPPSSTEKLLTEIRDLLKKNN